MLTKDDKIRQYGSIYHHDEEKIERLKLDKYGNSVRGIEAGIKLSNKLGKDMFRNKKTRKSTSKQQKTKKEAASARRVNLAWQKQSRQGGDVSCWKSR